MRPGSIYAAFGSKEGLFNEALALYFEISGREFERAMNGAATPLAGLAAYIRNLGQRLTEPNPSRACMLMKTILEIPEGDPVIRASAEDLARKTEQTFVQAFEAARAGGQLAQDDDPAQLAARLQMQIFGLRAYAQRSDVADRIPDLTEEIAQSLESLAVEAA